jgi:hypothetical protein
MGGHESDTGVFVDAEVVGHHAAGDEFGLARWFMGDGIDRDAPQGAYASRMERQRPPERICELVRRGATVIVNDPQSWLDELDEAVLSAASMKEIADDPVLAAGLRRVIRSNVLHWTAANVRDPGASVPPNLGPEPLSLARDLLRRGLTPLPLRAYRIVQSVFSQRWMSLAFQLTTDTDDLHELLAVSARSIFSFIDDTNAAITSQMQRDREELTRGTHAERRETVELILAGASIGTQRAASRPGYKLDQTHTAAIVWNDLPDADATLLERATEALAGVAGVHRPLERGCHGGHPVGVDARKCARSRPAWRCHRRHSRDPDRGRLDRAGGRRFPPQPLRRHRDATLACPAALPAAHRQLRRPSNSCRL